MEKVYKNRRKELGLLVYEERSRIGLYLNKNMKIDKEGEVYFYKEMNFAILHFLKGQVNDAY